MIAFQTPPPIEDLSELSWKRVEQGLQEKLDRLDTSGTIEDAQQGPRVWPWMVGGALAVAAATLFVVQRGTQENTAQVAKNTSEIRTQESNTSLVVDGAQLDVRPHTDLSVKQNGAALAFHLRHGSVLFDVAPRDPQSPASIDSGEVRLEFVSSTFSVSRSEGLTQVTVYEGLVVVLHSGQRDLIHAGEQWPTTDHPPSKEHHDAVAVSKAPKKNQEHDSSHRAIAKIAQPTTRQLFEQAAAQERSNPSKALRLYRQAAMGSGPWAPNALYAEARLQLSQGHASAAKALLEKYSDTYPSGANAADVASLLSTMKTK